VLRINRLKIEVKTSSKQFGFDEEFKRKINFIASNHNTMGKSSVIESIYYCLGLEELIGGKKEKTLKPVFRKKVTFNTKEYPVIDSSFYLEITNSKEEVITIYRTANKKNIDSNLIKVYSGTIDEVYESSSNVHSDDFFVHLKGAATNKKGFHNFLESFIDWKLPQVPTYDNKDNKLYLQILFSSFFIEQKRGWSGVFASLPTYLKVKEPKKRIVEYILELDSIKNERLQSVYNEQKKTILSKWKEEISWLNYKLQANNCKIHNMHYEPSEDFVEKLEELAIFKILTNGEVLINDHIENLDSNLNLFREKNLTIGDLNEELNDDLINLRIKLKEYENEFSVIEDNIFLKKGNIGSLENNIEQIKTDIVNNKDIAKLKKLGSVSEWSTSQETCPVCYQTIKDNLLPQDNNYNFMSIEENISHLQEQLAVLEFSLTAEKNEVNYLGMLAENYKSRISNTIKIIKSIINDIYSNDRELSEKVIREKIILEDEINGLADLIEVINKKTNTFKKLNTSWESVNEKLGELPKNTYSPTDKVKINKLRSNFVKNLEAFGFKSIYDKELIQIDETTLMPSSEGFNMNFDSSASDNVRAIWAFTIALLETSNYYKVNHPGIIIFDEPDQQSIIISDMKRFFKHLADESLKGQVIIGITIKEAETLEAIRSLDEETYKVIMLKEQAIRPI
jgi:hypothetical protein